MDDRPAATATATVTAAVDGAASDDLLALENQVCFALAVAARGVIGVYRPILEPLGLTHPQYLVMLALWEHSPRTLGDIARALALEPATLSPLLKRLEAAGYVTRGRSADDERALDVRLTAAGQALRSRAEQVPAYIDQDEVAEYRIRRNIARIDGGWTPLPDWRLAARLARGHDRVDLRVGNPVDFPDRASSFTSFTLIGMHDSLDDANFPSSGSRSQ